MVKAVIGALIAVAALSFINKFEMLGAQCYYIGPLRFDQTTCIAPPIIYGIYAVAGLLVLWGIADIIKTRAPNA